MRYLLCVCCILITGCDLFGDSDEVPGTHVEFHVEDHIISGAYDDSTRTQEFIYQYKTNQSSLREIDEAYIVKEARKDGLPAIIRPSGGRATVRLATRDDIHVVEGIARGTPGSQSIDVKMPVHIVLHFND